MCRRKKNKATEPFKKHDPIYFAIDNVYVKIDKYDGFRQLHETGTAAYHQKLE